VLKNGFGLFTNSAYWPENTVLFSFDLLILQSFKVATGHGLVWTY